MSADRNTDMILTQCPACRTLFRLSDEEQAACGGTVRCGHCGNVFQADVYHLGDAVPSPAPPQGRRRSRKAAWVVAIATLVVALLGQAAYWWRTELVILVPWHTQVASLMQKAGWRLPQPVAIHDLHIRNLTVTKGREAGVLHIRGQIANDAAFAQTPPLLAVSLLDAQGNLLVRRLYRPRNYLIADKTVIAPRTRVAMRLDLRGPAAAAAFRLGLYAQDAGGRPAGGD